MAFCASQSATVDVTAALQRPGPNGSRRARRPPPTTFATASAEDGHPDDSVGCAKIEKVIVKALDPIERCVNAASWGFSAGCPDGNLGPFPPGQATSRSRGTNWWTPQIGHLSPKTAAPGSDTSRSRSCTSPDGKRVSEPKSRHLIRFLRAPGPLMGRCRGVHRGCGRRGRPRHRAPQAGRVAQSG